MMFNMSRALLLLALLSGMYAHPHGIEFSEEKRGLEYLAYPAGYNAHNHPRSTEVPNRFGISFTKAANTKRSIIVETTNHTEYTDSPSLLQSRDYLCTIIAYIDPVDNFQALAGNTPEAFFRFRYTYVFNFVFDTVVKSVTTWERGRKDHYRKISTVDVHKTHGTLILHGMGGWVHYFFEFEEKEASEIHIGGRLAVFQLYG